MPNEVEIFAEAPGRGQVLTGAFEPSMFQSEHPVDGWNRLNVRFSTGGTIPVWVEWKLEQSDDGGRTWRNGSTTVLWSGTETRSRMVSTRPGISMVSVALPASGSVRIVARRNGGGQDTTVLATATFERVVTSKPRGFDPINEP